ncbi:MAG: hypothetical protein M3015_12635 [Bacteroidota bacterium]|nr:hypothetical protein [Bacteroidota bacterium]
METDTGKIFTKRKAILILVLSGVLSIVLAMAGVEYGAVELGALIYVIVPIIVTIIAIIIFLLIVSFTSIDRKRLTIILTTLILLIGIFLRFDFYYSIINW